MRKILIKRRPKKPRPTKAQRVAARIEKYGASRARRAPIDPGPLAGLELAMAVGAAAVMMTKKVRR